VEGSRNDPLKKELELRLRDARNRLIREYLTEGRSAFYVSSGNSMWPLVQSDDACNVYPIQAVTAKDCIHAVQKEASDICKGDIVFCQVQPSQQYFAHIVLDVEESWYHNEPKYWIGNIQRYCNGRLQWNSRPSSAPPAQRRPPQRRLPQCRQLTAPTAQATVPRR